MKASRMLRGAYRARSSADPAPARTQGQGYTICTHSRRARVDCHCQLAAEGQGRLRPQPAKADIRAHTATSGVGPATDIGWFEIPQRSTLGVIWSPPLHDPLGYLSGDAVPAGPDENFAFPRG